MSSIKPPSVPIEIPNPPYLADHRSEGRSILPATEALQYLARVAREHDPKLDTWRSRLAEFVRFLELPAGATRVPAEVELEPEPGGSLTARLLTRGPISTTGISRSRVHVEVEFGAAQPLQLPPRDTLVALEGICTRVDSERLYQELVPFGPSFHNIRGQVLLAPGGAVGRIQAAEHPAPHDPLGNPFVLDAAFHLACAWGQRYARVLAFPTGYTDRIVAAPCRSGDGYWCRVVPVAVEPDQLQFDLYVFDESGALREACLGARFQDVSAGRLRAADWVAAGAEEDPLADLRPRCAGLSVVELDGLAPFYDQAYTARERGRDLEMGAKRSRSFAGARLALKHLARAITQAVDTPADELQTVSTDRVHPLLPLPPGDPIRYCAAAHDDRFAVAVGADGPVGVDVERRSERVLRGSRLYLSEAEQGLVARSPLGEVETALRIWTVKESAAKALDIPLATAFSRVAVLEVDAHRCQANLDGHLAEAHLASVDDHVFCLVCLPAEPRPGSQP